MIIDTPREIVEAQLNRPKLSVQGWFNAFKVGKKYGWSVTIIPGRAEPITIGGTLTGVKRSAAYEFAFKRLMEESLRFDGANVVLSGPREAKECILALIGSQGSFKARTTWGILNDSCATCVLLWQTEGEMRWEKVKRGAPEDRALQRSLWCSWCRGSFHPSAIQWIENAAYCGPCLKEKQQIQKRSRQQGALRDAGVRIVVVPPKPKAGPDNRPWGSSISR